MRRDCVGSTNSYVRILSPRASGSRSVCSSCSRQHSTNAVALICESALRSDIEKDGVVSGKLVRRAITERLALSIPARHRRELERKERVESSRFEALAEARAGRRKHFVAIIGSSWSRKMRPCRPTNILIDQCE